MKPPAWLTSGIAERVFFDAVLVVAVSAVALFIQEIREDARVDEQERVAMQTALSLEEDLTGRVLAGLDLHRVRLPQRDMRGVDLTDTILDGADLRGADLSGSTLVGAQLEHARLGPVTRRSSGTEVGDSRFRTNLTDAVLDRADLRDADLDEALLYGASFLKAHLEGVSLTGACYDESTVWPDGFEPPISGVGCSPQGQDVVVGDREELTLTPEMSQSGDIYYSTDKMSTFVYVAATGASDASCSWSAAFDDWKILPLDGSHVLLGVSTDGTGKPHRLIVYRLGGWVDMPTADENGCQNLGVPGVDWDPSAFPGVNVS